MLNPAPHKVNTILEQQLDERLKEFEVAIGGDALTFWGPLTFPVDDTIREAVEELRSGKGEGEKLAVLLQTEGGYIETAERIARVFRRHYKVVEFVVPNYAMSAGTVLAMSGDAIYMDYFSVLGPIDPQVPGAGGALVPALGYLTQFERLIKKSKNKAGLTHAEEVYLITKFDPAELYRYEQERDLSISLLEKWLVTFKFKNWNLTRTRKKKVTPAMRRKRAKDIGMMLNDTEKWHSHGRGISRDVLVAEVKLEIDDFGSNALLNEKVKGYYRLLEDYMQKHQQQFAVLHTRGHYVPFFSGG